MLKSFSHLTLLGVSCIADNHYFHNSLSIYKQGAEAKYVLNDFFSLIGPIFEKHAINLKFSWFGLVSLFNGISTFIGYLTPKLFS